MKGKGANFGWRGTSLRSRSAAGDVMRSTVTADARALALGAAAAGVPLGRMSAMYWPGRCGGFH
jgi:hypothetical protein